MWDYLSHQIIMIEASYVYFKKKTSLAAVCVSLGNSCVTRLPCLSVCFEVDVLSLYLI